MANSSLNPGSLLSGNTLTIPQDQTLGAVERFARILGCNLLYVRSMQQSSDGPGVVAEFRDTGNTLTFPTARAAAAAMKRMAYAKLYGAEAPQRMAVDDAVAQRAVAAGLVVNYRQSFPEIKAFADEVMDIVKEMQTAAKEQAAQEPVKELPRRLINLTDD